MQRPFVVRAVCLIAAIAALAVPDALSAQAGQVSGTVVASENNAPLGAVQVYLDGTSRAAITRADGTFAISNIPPGTYTLIAQSIGYQQFRQQEVRVTASGNTVLRLVMQPTVLAIQGVVATGLIDPVEGVRSPITVARVDREAVPVTPTTGVISMIEGVVPGVTGARVSGQPGANNPILLRTSTSARGDNQPLIIVDGVILGTDAGANVVDIESMDVESVEVIKGAAAASIYGSRAAAGVISITTNRGRGLAAGTTRFTMRSEMGYSGPADFSKLPTHHPYALNAAGTGYVNEFGRDTTRAGRYIPQVAFLDKEYPTPIYDNMNAIYRPGDFNTQTFSIAGNMSSTNFFTSFNRYQEKGAMEGNNGYIRNGVRLNVDHRFLDALTLGVSVNHTRAARDELISSGGGGFYGLFQDILIIPPDVDISKKDENGNFLQQPDPTIPFENTIWRQYARSNVDRRVRTQGSASLRWNPVTWLSSSAEVSFDLQESKQRVLVAKGTPTSVTDEFAESNGLMQKDSGMSDTFNGNVSASVRRDLGPLNTRTTVRAIIERAASEDFSSDASTFHVEGVEGHNAAQSFTIDSSETETRALGYLLDTALDYSGKYIGTLLLRRDGSSRFGPDNRWHNYYRAALAWRVAEEPWFNIPNVDELKLRYARGTAGGRPGYNNQYEVWNVGATSISKSTLGNRDLKPEHTTEQELGLDLILFGRVSAELVHARQVTTDQIINAPLPAVLGYTSQYINSGTIEGQTTEIRVEARVINRPRLSWTTTLTGDRSTGKVTHWPQPCVADTVTRTCEGDGIRDIWLYSWARSPEDLPARFQPFASQFQRNDEGYMVWVGEGNGYREGIAKQLWGTQATLGGQIVGWGLPVLKQNERGERYLEKVGSGDPAFQLGWLNNLAIGSLTLHAQVHGVFDREVHNQTRMFLHNWFRMPEMDQAGRPDELKKPVHYYTELYQAGSYTDAFLEDASYIRLRTLSASYRFNADRLRRIGLGSLGLSSLAVNVVGRDLFTLTDYSGFDPQTGSTARMSPFDRFNYPATKTFTASVEVNF